MKVACEACGARYAIPDDKVRGSSRTFKVTCRQCGEVLIIQGAANHADDPVWHYAVGRDRRGPVNIESLKASFDSGEITGASLVWQQGMPGWVALETVTELNELITGPAEVDLDADALTVDTEPTTTEDTTLVSRSELHAAHAAMSALGDPPVEDAGAASGDLLDALRETSALDESNPVHERNDTSVLFSLDDLTNAKSSLPNPIGDTSGLIDVTAVKDRTANRKKPLTQSPFDDGPAPVTRRSAEGPTIAVPVIKRRTNHLPMILGAVVLVGGGAFAGMQMMQAPDTAPAAPEKVAAAPKQPATPAPAAAAPAAKAAEAPKAAEAAEAPKAEAPTPTAEPDAQAEGAAKEPAGAQEGTPSATADASASPDAGKPMTAKERRRQRRLERRERLKREREARAANKSANKGEAKSAPKPEPKPEPKPAPVAKAEPTKPAAAPAAPKKDVNALLAQLNKNKASESSSSSASSGNLPARLSSSKLRSTLRKKRGQFANCYKKMTDRPSGGITVNTSLVVAGSGRVKSVRITSGGGASSAVLRCISSALKGVKFPPFSSAQMPVNYPIVLR